ncbi:phosphohydrolase [Pseudomonas fulva]|uniref:phosphohydrolase n=1 Tax=Pseudomonas fulva TaxID=47880 RepID=UPI00201D8F42|nr:phosphohydrolase [Pseudomonas fulva]UQY33789.1 phosphohydrolase [Pseudomonas fulva]
MTWILTNQGIRFELLEPTAAMIHPADIAFSLARLCRFNGHTSKHYSVAEHSFRVHELVDAEHQLHALLHDATEAYIGDMTRPLKLAMRGYAQDMAVDDVYGQVEQRIWLAICERFDLEPELPDQVKEADMYMLAVERRDLMPDHPDAWDCIQGIELPAWRIKPWSAEEARDRYFQRLMSLLTTTHRARATQ